jgi:nondiscriminating glutamyl-tRNA synthetase
MADIRVRIPPSPTGLLHIGTVRTALYNYLFAKHNGGTMVFRIEDTDKERSTKEFEDDIVNGLVKLGIAGDEGVHIKGTKGYRQSERTEVYAKDIKKLLDEDKAYYCFCSKERLDDLRKEQETKKLPPRYDGCCAGIKPEEAKKRVEAGEKAVIRLRVPKDKDLSFNDLVRGKVVMHSKELDDFVIARSVNDPLYHLTVVVDDHDMKITHVIRGEDHVSNTPKQILIFQALGWKIPEFAHLPLILNEDRSKLSKRKNKVSVDDYLKEGYLPHALLNFLALIGWNPGDTQQEIFTMEELIDKFSLNHVHKGGAVFDIKKLDWVNGEYIKNAIAEDIDKFFETVLPFIKDKLPTNKSDLIKKILIDPDFEGRFRKLSEIGDELKVFFGLQDYEYGLMAKDKFGITSDILKKTLTLAKDRIQKIDWKKKPADIKKEIEDKMGEIVTETGYKNGQVFWPIRVALSGLEKSPNYSTLMTYLGKDESLRRLDVALNKIE